MIYTFKSNGQTYELDVYLESTDNAPVAQNDGGTGATVYEIGTNPGLSLIP